MKSAGPVFAIHGGGNIGLGLMADIVSKSPVKYQIIATSGDVLVNSMINCSNQLLLMHPDSNHTNTLIKNVQMVYSRSRHNIIQLYTHAKILAICLTEEGLINSAGDIASGLMTRDQLTRSELTVLVLMNRPNCDNFVRHKIIRAMLMQGICATHIRNILKKIKFIATVPDRIVSKVPEKNLLMQLKYHSGSLYPHEPDACRFKYKHQGAEKRHPVFSIFNAEKSFSLIVPDYLSEAEYLPGVRRVRNLDTFTTIKSRYINGPHAVLAWLGGLIHCRTIAEAINNPDIFRFINDMMEREITPVLMAEYPDISRDEFMSLKSLFINRCKTNIMDPILRVGRDPFRKLNQKGCIGGIIELRSKHQLETSLARLERGIAAGLLYAIKRIDPDNEECRKIHKIYCETRSYKSVLYYKESYNTGTYLGFDPVRDKVMLTNIIGILSSHEILARKVS